MLALQQRAAATGFEVQSGLPALLSSPLHQRKLMGTVVVVAAVQLVLLAIWVLTSVLMRSADLRRAELRVARLRGFPPPTLVAVSIAEPAALCAVGVVLGIGGAWVVVRAAASILFTDGTVVRPDAWTFVGFAAVLVTIGVVLAISTVRLLRSSGLVVSSPQSASTPYTSRDRRGDPCRLGVALVGASTSGALSSHSNPVAAAAPAVVALGTSVIAIRIVEYLCRRLSTADPRLLRRGQLPGGSADRAAADGAARGADAGDRGRPGVFRGVCVVGRSGQPAHRREVLDRRADGRDRHRG